MDNTKTKIGVAGVGALGSIVCEKLLQNTMPYKLTGISDIKETDFDIPNMSFEELAHNCDIIVECLPPSVVSELAETVLAHDKTLILITSSELLTNPDLQALAQKSNGRIIVPSGALSGLDAVKALYQGGINKAVIRSTKPPKAFLGAPYIQEKHIDVLKFTQKTLIFSGNVLEAAKAFPANVNVAATLSLATKMPDNTIVEVWADPATQNNSHEIEVKGGRSTITSRVENVPDPANPKSSTMAAYSIIATLENLSSKIAIL